MSLHYRLMIVALLPFSAVCGAMMGWPQSIVLFGVGGVLLELFAIVEDIRGAR